MLQIQVIHLQQHVIHILGMVKLILLAAIMINLFQILLVVTVYILYHLLLTRVIQVLDLIHRQLLFLGKVRQFLVLVLILQH